MHRDGPARPVPEREGTMLVILRRAVRLSTRGTLPFLPPSKFAPEFHSCRYVLRDLQKPVACLADAGERHVQVCRGTEGRGAEGCLCERRAGV